MLVSELFDVLFPGDKKLGIPSFSNCDKIDIVTSFFSQIDRDTILTLKKIDETKIDLDELIIKIEAELPDIKKLLNSAISFYFSRPKVVILLTGRRVPLTSNGMAVY